MKRLTLLLIITIVFIGYSCSNDDSPQLQFSETEFLSISGEGGKTYRVIEASNSGDIMNETNFPYSPCHLDDIYEFRSPTSFIIRVGDSPCFYEAPPIERALTYYDYSSISGDIMIQTQRHEQTGDEVFRLTYSLYLESIEPNGRLIFEGRDSHIGRRLVLEEIN